jgi:hypothetical protein
VQLSTPRDESLLLVIGDSLTFYGQSEIWAHDDPRILPNRMAAHLTEATGRPWRAALAAHGGRTIRETYKLLRTDEELRDLVRSADAVYLAVGGKDSVLTPFPLWARMAIGRLPKARRGPVSRFVRAKLALVTDHRFQFTSQRLFERCWHGSIGAIRALNPGADIISATPSRPYGPQTILEFPADLSARFGSRVTALGIADGVAVVDLQALVPTWFDGRFCAPDYLHWPAEVHDLAAQAAADLLLAAMGGQADRPGNRLVGSAP